MAVVRETDKVSVNIMLNNGTKNGKVQEISLSIGQISPGQYDEQKAMNVKQLLEPLLDKSVYRVQETRVATLSTN